jgi:hypothetical protein
MGKSICIALSVNIDRFDDAYMAREFLDMFRQQKGFTTVAQIRAYCAQARAKGLEVFPPCDNADERGRCKGHEPSAAERLSMLETLLASEFTSVSRQAGPRLALPARERLAKLCREYLDLLKETGDGCG